MKMINCPICDAQAVNPVTYPLATVFFPVKCGACGVSCTPSLGGTIIAEVTACVICLMTLSVLLTAKFFVTRIIGILFLLLAYLLLAKLMARFSTPVAMSRMERVELRKNLSVIIVLALAMMTIVVKWLYQLRYTSGGAG